MEWTQFLILIAILGGLFLWNRSEARNDYRHLENAMKDQGSRLENAIKEQGSRIDQLYQMFCEMQKEIKDLYQKGK